MFEALGAVLVGVVLVAAIGWRAWDAYFRLPTFQQYKQRHPQLVGPSRCKCRHCGGRRIFLQCLDLDIRRHICMTCGEPLYRS